MAPRRTRVQGVNDVPPPSVDPDTIDIRQPAAQSLYSAGTGAQEDEEEIHMDESTDERAHSAAAARDSD